MNFPVTLLSAIPPDKRRALIEVLAQDPRPGYRHGEAKRRYGVAFAGFDVRFTVEGNALTVVEIEKL